MFEALCEIMSKPGNRFNYARAVKKNKALSEWIESATAFSAGSSFKTRIYLVVNGLAEIPKCPTCGATCGPDIISNSAGFRTYCGPKCAIADDAVRKKKEKTTMERYGVPNASMDPGVRRKVEETVKARYGVDVVSKAAQFVEKAKATKLGRYGDASYNNKEKAVRTCLERYGVEHSTQSARMKECSRKTCMERYGVPNGGWTERAREKIAATNRAKRGTDFPMQSPETKAKAERTFVEKYGVKTPFQLERVRRKSVERAKTASYEDFIARCEFDRPLFSLQEYLARTDDSQELEFRCLKCGKTFKARHRYGAHSRCPDCWPRFAGTSEEEKELAAFVRENAGCAVEENVRNVVAPYELDVYVPSKKTAFEFDGIYWHSERYKGRRYHLDKTEACEKAGIRLVHVFENEWLFKKDLVKARILAMLGEKTETVFARKCRVAEISPAAAAEFLDANHMQGAVPSSANFGLFDGGRLVAAMCFSKCRFTKKYEYELTRYCSLAGTRVTGGAGRLLKAFERTRRPKSLVSYADRRWSAGGMYEKLGFKFLHDSPPDYWYAKTGSLMLESRVKYQKHRLASLLEKFDPSKTEKQNMSDNGYMAIYDCGNKVYVKEYI